MPRSFTVHPASLALGLVIAGVAFLAMGQATVPMPLRVEYVPHPRDMVQIWEGTPYTVPAGKLFVLTGIGSTGNHPGYCTQGVPSSPMQIPVWLSVNAGGNGSPGCAQVSFVGNVAGQPGASMWPVPAGFTAIAGSVLEVWANAQSGTIDQGARAWGYLVAQ